MAMNDSLRMDMSGGLAEYGSAVRSSEREAKPNYNYFITNYNIIQSIKLFAQLLLNSL